MRVLACLLALCPSLALACPSGAVQDDIMADALKQRGYALRSWALNSAGNTEELWQLPSGEWAVVETTPSQCSTFKSRPTQFMGRLSTPSNDADPMGQGSMTDGEPA